jgi:hypothetical protein
MEKEEQKQHLIDMIKDAEDLELYKEQTAVDWLIDQLEKYELYSKISFQCLKEIEQAKEMEKEQIIDAYFDSTSQFSVDARMDYPKSAEQYYNETFGKL